MTSSALSAVLGVLLTIAAFGPANYLAAGDKSSTGYVGFLLLLALPGLALIAWAWRRRSGVRWTLPIGAAAFCLLGLDVVDSARFTVVLAGWTLAAAAAAVTAGVTAFLARGHEHGALRTGSQSSAARVVLAQVDLLLVALVTCLPLVFIAVFIAARMVTGEP